MDFNPPIASRSQEDLLKIASDWETWQPEARALARVELEKRGVSVEVIEERSQAFSSGHIARQEVLEANSHESYSYGKMLLIFIGSPAVLIGRFVLHDWGFRLGLSQLDRRNYKKMYRQRMVLLIAGVVFWLALIGSLT